MSKDLSISMLLDFYGQLLTQKQGDALDLYYNQDLSLSEIAAHMNITRQGVRDNIKRGERQLLKLEEDIGLAKRFSSVSAICDIVNEYIQKLSDMELSESAKEYLEDISYNIKKLENIV